MDDFILEHPFLKNCAPFVLAQPHLVPSADYSTRPPPPALPLYIRSRLRLTLTPTHPSTPSEPSPAMSKPGADIFLNSMNVTREAMEATGHAFVAIGASMDVRKWSWPGYLTFQKGIQPKTASQDEPVDDKKGSEDDRPDEAAAADGVPGEHVPSSHEIVLRGDVDRESLHEAISTDGREVFHENAPTREEDTPVPAAPAPAVDSTSQTEEAMALAGVELQTVIDYSQDEQDPSPLASPSTPVIYSSTPPSLSSSQITLPVPVPTPSFRSFSLHFSPHDDPLVTVPRRVLYTTVSEHPGCQIPLTRLSSQKEQLTFAFLEPTTAISDDDIAALYQTSSSLIANVQGLIDHDEASNAETPLTAMKILQPKDKYMIAKHNDTTVTSAGFASYSEHLFNGSQMIA